MGYLLESRAALVVWLGLLLAVFAAPAEGDVTYTGDVIPDYDWPESSLIVGQSGVGSVEISAGSSRTNDNSCLGMFAGAEGTVTVVDAGSRWTSTVTTTGIGGYVTVGSEGVGRLFVRDGGAVVSTYGFLGAKTGSQGTATITGTDANWAMPEDLYVGGDEFGPAGAAGAGGTGFLNVLAGGAVSSASGYVGYEVGSVGTATVDGANSAWAYTGSLTVGCDGQGTLEIRNGGSVTGRSGTVGSYGSGMGSATVDGNDSTWTLSSQLNVGTMAKGTLDIRNGGVVTCYTASLGTFAGGLGGQVTVEGAGSALNLTSSGFPTSMLAVGSSGVAALTIRNGGSVSDYSARVGYRAGSSGTVTVEGSGASWTNTGQLLVGDCGQGELTVRDGGSLSCDQFRIGTEAGSEGTITVEGAESTWRDVSVETNYQSYVGMNGTGTLNVLDGGGVVSGACSVGYSPGSVGTVLVAGDESTWSIGELWSYLRSVYVGDRGVGSVTVADSGRVNSTGYSYLGFSADSRGTVTVDGAGSKWVSSCSMSVGYQGNGQLTVRNAGEATGVGFVGRFGGSVGTVLVTGEGSACSTAGTLGVGSAGEGTVTVTDRADVSCRNGRIGDDASGDGRVSIDGPGATWTTTEKLSVGISGTGRLDVLAGGLASCVDGCVGDAAGGRGTVTVSGPDSELAASGDLYVGVEGSGSVTVSGGGDVSNGYGQLGELAGSRGTVLVTGDGSRWQNRNNLYAGMSGSASVRVEGGASLLSNFSHLGRNADGQGDVTVTGEGTTWTSYSRLYVGFSGSGELAVRDGAEVASYVGYLAAEPGSTGRATVDGAGSAWRITDDLYVGGDDGGSGGDGSLHVSNGGEVTAYDVMVYATGTLAVQVGPTAGLTAGDDLTNDGVIRLSAAANLPAGAYEPLAVAGSWRGTGAYVALGGVWDENAHTFTVAAAETAQSGIETQVDLAAAPRLDITDPAGGGHLAASFPAGAETIEFTATAMDEPTGLADLSIQLTADQDVLSAWDFDTDLAAGEPVLLSFFVGEGLDAEAVEVWHYDAQGQWTPFDAADLAYDDGWITFTVDGFSGYAVTTVPAPATLSLLALAAPAVLARRKKKGDRLLCYK